MKFNMILATDDKNGIGKGGDLAWKIGADMKYFKEITTQVEISGKINALIMGKNTWFSIPEKFRPLNNRINCILSSSFSKNDILEQYNNTFWFNSFEQCLDELNKKENIENIFIIGGGSLYNSLLNHNLLDKIYLTKIKGDFHCDVFFDGIPKNFKLISEEDELEEEGIKYSFCIYKK